MKIADVSEKYGLSPDTLRYYERIGLISTVNRKENGIRDYDEADLQRIEFIKCMRRAGLPIDVLIDYIGLVEQGDSTIEERKAILQEQRRLLVTRMEEMQQTLNVLDYKINLYDEAVLKKEKAMNRKIVKEAIAE